MGQLAQHRVWTSKAGLRANHVLTFMVVLVLAALAQAQTFTTLYSFTDGSDGAWPLAGVIQGPASNLYGTTASGGDFNCGDSYGCGVVYKLDTAGRETVLHSFTGYRSDGAIPVTPVARDKAGNIYGTTESGGSSYYYGTVFKIDTAGNETVLYSFSGGSDGCNPYQGLVIGKSGTVFGTTSYCGASGGGTIFKVDSAGNFTLLHSFAGYPSDGGEPYLGHLVMDKSGNIYGLTVEGGAYGGGVLYKLSKSGKLTLLHSFGSGTDGCEPSGSVVQDKAGNLYGTAFPCGSNDYGTIWKVSKKGKETILHNFAGGTTDGCYPYAGVARDSEGNLYGVTEQCGAKGAGALYELSAKGRLTLLHSFDYSDGYEPIGEVWRTGKGTLFGTAYSGGSGFGTAWSYVP